MITKICKINNAGSYKEFDGSCIEDFKRFNFIFGENGSGKTILSKLFCLCSDSEDEEYKKEITNELFDTDTVIEFKIDDKPVKCKKESYPTQKIYVFNSAFVTNNLTDEGSFIKVKSFKMPNDLRLENNEIKSLTTEIKRIEDLVSAKKKDLTKMTDLMKKVSEQIRTEYNSIKELEGTRLTIDNKKISFATLRSLQDIQKDIDTRISQLNIIKNNDNEGDINTLLNNRLPVLDIDFEAINNLLIQIIKNDSKEKVIEKLKEIEKILGDRESQSWLSNGYKLLQNTLAPHTCPLCNSDLSNTFDLLLHEYENYFSKEFENFQSLLSQTKEDIKKLINSLSTRTESVLQTIIEKYPFLKDDIEPDSYIIGSNLISILIDELNKVYNMLELKQTQYETKEEWNYSKLQENIILYKKKVAVINSIIKRILEYLQGNLGSQKNMEEMVKKLFIEKYYTTLANLSSKKEPLKYYFDLDSVISTLNDELQKNNVKRKEQLAKLKFESKYVNEYLQKLNITRFSVNIDTNLEVLYKDSSKVKKSIKHSLSDGEKTTLAFAYYLSKIRAELAGTTTDYTKKYADCIFYIDDPVSSLDENRLFFTANVLYNEFCNSKQLFVSSHNLKFLKILINYPFPNRNEDICLYEIRYDKFSAIRNLPETLWNFNTTYYYKLQQILDYIGGTIGYEQAICYIPNNIRVVLESFLSFKFCYLKGNKIGNTPGLPELLNKVKKEKTAYFGNLKPVEGIDKDNWKEHLDIVILKVSDSFSHGSPINMEPSTQTISDEELKSICKTVINLMKFMDNVHVDKAESIVGSAS